MSVMVDFEDSHALPLKSWKSLSNPLDSNKISKSKIKYENKYLLQLA